MGDPLHQFELRRIAYLNAGVFGVLLHLGEPFAVSLEHSYPPDNAPKIPPGLYRCTKTMFFGGGYSTYEIHVLGHSRILFHIANTEADVDGCVGVGESFGALAGSTAILDSGKGFAEFMARAHDEPEFWLLVRES